MTNRDAPARHHVGPPTHRSVPVAEAVGILGLSSTTIRRRIDAGELEAERVVRPQGTAFLVKVPSGAPPRADDASSGASEAPSTPRDAPGTNRDAPAGPTGLAAVLVPLVAQLAAAHETIRAQAETIGALNAQVANRDRELIRFTAELERARAERDAADAARWRENRRVWIILTVASALAVAGLLASAWVR